ncbi:unnamed protein product [Linum trigynum]|uniref:Secreted protein n=1 Tax=Linum trigynum TaxID=586398 RepID=A0AAV2FXX8_9ROSI
MGPCRAGMGTLRTHLFRVVLGTARQFSCRVMQAHLLTLLDRPRLGYGSNRVVPIRARAVLVFVFNEKDEYKRENEKEGGNWMGKKILTDNV